MRAGLIAVPVALLGLAGGPPVEAAERWIQLFNGRDLSGWTPKIRGLALGEDPARTFRVADGLLKVSYDGYRSFEGRFGHLAWKQPYAHYRLRVEYRFVGEQCPGGPGWAFRNSGVMIHGQAPATMEKDQEFPVSIEVQFLGGKDGDPAASRPTANMCSPGTHVVYEGKLATQHCIQSRSRTYPGDRWVTVEVRVQGGRLIEHLVDGQVVLRYGGPQLDAGKRLEGGFIYLQAESHPVEFRKVELLPERGG
jgi:hypothetical protein